jgi:hypothetical protein
MSSYASKCRGAGHPFGADSEVVGVGIFEIWPQRYRAAIREGAEANGFTNASLLRREISQPPVSAQPRQAARRNNLDLHAVVAPVTFLIGGCVAQHVAVA